jgi:hypothetical protein
MSKKLFSFSIIFGALVVFLPKGASADLGPKPSVDIDVVYNQQIIPDINFSARMLRCLSQDQKQVRMEDKTVPQLEINEYDSPKNCYWVPARLAGGGQCSNGSCHFGYMPPSEFKLAVFIPSIDKVFITNEISRTNFNSRYKAELFSDGSAKISETTPVLSSDKISSFAKAFPITIILELLVSLIFLSVRKLPKKILAYILLANIISLPIVWFLFPLVKLPILAIIVMSEIFAVLFETYFVYLLNKQIISFKQSLTLNILNNLASLFVGGFVYGLLGIFGL